MNLICVRYLFFIAVIFFYLIKNKNEKRFSELLNSTLFLFGDVYDSKINAHYRFDLLRIVENKINTRRVRNRIINERKARHEKEATNREMDGFERRLVRSKPTHLPHGHANVSKYARVRRIVHTHTRTQR